MISASVATMPGMYCSQQQHQQGQQQQEQHKHAKSCCQQGYCLLQCDCMRTPAGAPGHSMNDDCICGHLRRQPREAGHCQHVPAPSPLPPPGRRVSCVTCRPLRLPRTTILLQRGLQRLWVRMTWPAAQGGPVVAAGHPHEHVPVLRPPDLTFSSQNCMT